MDKHKLTSKQQLFISHYIRGETGTQAAKAAYSTTNENTAAVIASENLRKPKIVAEIERMTDLPSAVLDKALEELSVALEATKYNRYTKSYVPDHIVRLRASKAALKLLGWY
jgi:phage terminase small subunit